MFGVVQEEGRSNNEDFFFFFLLLHTPMVVVVVQFTSDMYCSTHTYHIVKAYYYCISTFLHIGARPTMISTIVGWGRKV